MLSSFLFHFWLTAKSSKAANIIARDATINGTTTEGKRHHTKRMPLFTAGDIASPPTGKLKFSCNLLYLLFPN